MAKKKLSADELEKVLRQVAEVERFEQILNPTPHLTYAQAVAYVNDGGCDEIKDLALSHLAGCNMCMRLVDALERDSWLINFFFLLQHGALKEVWRTGKEESVASGETLEFRTGCDTITLSVSWGKDEFSVLLGFEGLVVQELRDHHGQLVSVSVSKPNDGKHELRFPLVCSDVVLNLHGLASPKHLCFTLDQEKPELFLVSQQSQSD